MNAVGMEPPGEVLDTGENGLHGTARNGANTSSLGSQLPGSGYHRHNQGVEVPDDARLDFTGNDWTIAFWYLMLENSSGGWDQIFVKGNGSTPQLCHVAQTEFRADPFSRRSIQPRFRLDGRPCARNLVFYYRNLYEWHPAAVYRWNP